MLPGAAGIKATEGVVASRRAREVEPRPPWWGTTNTAHRNGTGSGESVLCRATDVGGDQGRTVFEESPRNQRTFVLVPWRIHGRWPHDLEPD